MRTPHQPVPAEVTCRVMEVVHTVDATTGRRR